MSENKLRIGISACLLGDRVRYDGGHKNDGFITGTLGEWFEWVKVCPEIEAGLGTPRPAMRLVQKGREVRLETIQGQKDRTELLQSFSENRSQELLRDNLRGYILKKGSPSCGLERVNVYGKNGERRGFGSGLFAQAMTCLHPDLPIEEEGRLGDPALRENWLGRVFLYARLQELWKSKWGLKDLVAFHAAHKFLILAHSPKAYSALGRLVAGAKKVPRPELQEKYQTELMKAARTRASKGRHTNVLQHTLGYLRTHLDASTRQELEAYVLRYRKGEIPLLVPLTLIHHHARVHQVRYLLEQVYLDPARRELRTF